MARGRKALELDEKVENAKTADPSIAQNDFSAWLVEHTGMKIDIRTLIAVQKLYPEYIKTPEAASAIAERKAEAEKNKAERNAKSLTAFQERAAKLGFRIEKVEEDDAE